jgi:hypothetical protein
MAGVAALATALPAQAGPVGFRLRVDVTGGNGVVISDGGPGDLDPTPGSIATNTPSPANNITQQQTAGTSSPPFSGVGHVATLDMSPRISWNAAGLTITVNLESDGFVNPDGGAGTQLVFSGIIGGTLTGAGNSGTAQGWLNTSNNVPIYGSDVLPFGAVSPYPVTNTLAGNNILFGASGFSIPVGAFMGGAGKLVTKTGSTYSLFEQIVITTTGSGQLTGDFSVSVDAVPAPAGLVLAASGLTSLGLAWLRRRIQRIPVAVG